MEGNKPSNGRKVEYYNRIKGLNGRLALEEVKVRMISKEYFEDLYNIDIQEQVAVSKSSFDEFRRGNYFAVEPIRGTEVEVRVGKLTGEMTQGGGGRLCNMAFEGGVVPKEWRPAVTVPLYKCKGDRTECSNYKGYIISFLSVVGKIYTGILVDRVRKMTEGLYMMSKRISEQGGGV